MTRRLFAVVLVAAVVALAAGLAAFASSTGQTTDPTVAALKRRVAMTPDRLLGRVESVRTNISLLTTPLGPLAAGLLLSNVSARVTIAVFAAFGLVLALWGTLSPSIRSAPSLDELDDLGTSRPSAAATV